jgi:hypothetical protein
MPDGAEAAEEASAAGEPPKNVAPGQATEPPAYVELSPNGRFGRVRRRCRGRPGDAAASLVLASPRTDAPSRGPGAPVR